MEENHQNISDKSVAETVIEIKNLNKSFGEKEVLKNLHLFLKKGESLGILGKSGSGKSVLIKCIIGLIQPETGEIIVLGKDVTKLGERPLNELRKKIGFLFQSNALYDSLTVKENLEFPLRRHKLTGNNSDMDLLVNEALENVGLLHTLDMYPSELSGGMRKRVSLARTLILKPEIILYDEPTTGLDPITSREISNLIVHIQKKYNTSSIIISHDLNCLRIASDRIILLADGASYASGSYEELKNSADSLIKNYFE